MDKLVINGGKSLNGSVTISGAKNAVVAIIPAALLVDGKCIIENVPTIDDVSVITDILSQLGAKIKLINKTTLEIDCTHVDTYCADNSMVRKMRASYYLMGALLGKFNKAVVSMPGGCDFGSRPIDQHLKGFKALGAEITQENGNYSLRADQLVGSHIFFDVVSVGATINVMLAAVKAQGLTIIENAAKEPHIVDVANFLNSMGANIKGAGTDVIKIKGVDFLRGGTYSVIPDYIEAGTYMLMAAGVGGDVIIKNVIPKHLESISAKLIETGANVVEYDDSIRVINSSRLQPCRIKTLPYPGFPTDLQPLAVTLLTTASGTSYVNESVWDNRFQYIDELRRFGANINVDGNTASIEGVSRLEGCQAKAVDLRAGAAMVMAALMAQGQSEITNLKYIDRGYEDLEEKLTNLGADIKRICDFEGSPLNIAN
ncbi:MAG: UDP-N-acetylglucosamine 1-carboxyvinyltransferase [Clostridia bacterium]|nr:UDP-N-acetylglucosamine 1-carboxyvinyltransferase [Clostridia bacterium]